MTEQEILKQYIDACELLKETENDLAKLRKKSKAVVTDKVQASNPEFPYQPISVTVQGDPSLWDGTEKEIAREEAVLIQRKEQCARLKTDAERFINTVPPRIARIIRLRYFQRKSWEEVSIILERGATADSVRKELDAHFKNMAKEKLRAEAREIIARRKAEGDEDPVASVMKKYSTTEIDRIGFLNGLQDDCKVKK